MPIQHENRTLLNNKGNVTPMFEVVYIECVIGVNTLM